VENEIFFSKKNIDKETIKSYIDKNNIKYIFVQEKDRKITNTGYDFQQVYINNPNIKIILKELETKVAYKDFQTTIYLIKK
jgi:uncharacterized protein YjiK